MDDKQKLNDLSSECIDQFIILDDSELKYDVLYCFREEMTPWNEFLAFGEQTGIKEFDYKTSLFE